jgi:ribosome modulation factor
MTTPEAAEPRSAIARYRAEIREEQTTRMAYATGHMACLVGDAATACPYRRPDRRNAWLRGWQTAEQERTEAEAPAGHGSRGQKKGD